MDEFTICLSRRKAERTGELCIDTCESCIAKVALHFVHYRNQGDMCCFRWHFTKAKRGLCMELAYGYRESIWYVSQGTLQDLLLYHLQREKGTCDAFLARMLFA